MSQSISRKEAVEKGLTKYFTGKACSRGHVAERYCKNGACQACLQKTNAIAVRSVLSQTLEGQIVSDPDPRLEFINRKLAIQEAEVENESRRIAIKEKSIALKSQIELQKAERKSEALGERSAAREHRRFIKEHLVPVNILAIGNDYPVAVSIVWMAALMRNPQITKEDVLTGRMKDGHYVMRCFPEDKELVIKQTYNLYSQHHADVERSREQAIASTQAAETAEIEAEWPEFRP